MAGAHHSAGGLGEVALPGDLAPNDTLIPYPTQAAANGLTQRTHPFPPAPILLPGSLGVHFLQLKDSKNVAVLKQGSADSAADAFCASLYNLLGVRTPKTRVLSLSEWQEVLMSLRTVPFTEQGAGAVLQDSRAKQAGGTVQEFVRGFTIKDPRAGELFECVDGHGDGDWV